VNPPGSCQILYFAEFCAPVETLQVVDNVPGASVPCCRDHLKKKRRENGENVNPISEHRLRGSQLERAMNLVDRLRTSAHERVLSWRRAVVIS